MLTCIAFINLRNNIYYWDGIASYNYQLIVYLTVNEAPSICDPTI